MPRKLLIRKIHILFDEIQSSEIYKKIQVLPLPLKIISSIFFFWIGIFGVIFPLLPGMIFIIAGIVIIIGIRQARKYSIRAVYKTRLHLLFARIYTFWKNK